MSCELAEPAEDDLTAMRERLLPDLEERRRAAEEKARRTIERSLAAKRT